MFFSVLCMNNANCLESFIFQKKAIGSRQHSGEKTRKKRQEPQEQVKQAKRGTQAKKSRKQGKQLSQ